MRVEVSLCARVPFGPREDGDDLVSNCTYLKSRPWKLTSILLLSGFSRFNSADYSGFIFYFYLELR